jgi:hypothetical protein
MMKKMLGNPNHEINLSGIMGKKNHDLERKRGTK